MISSSEFLGLNEIHKLTQNTIGVGFGSQGLLNFLPCSLLCSPSDSTRLYYMGISFLHNLPLLLWAQLRWTRHHWDSQGQELAPRTSQEWQTAHVWEGSGSPGWASHAAGYP